MGNIAPVINHLVQQPGVEVCYDIGANVGFVSWLMLSWGRRVFAWEPNPAMLPYLNHNAPGITELSTDAVSNHDGTAQFTHCTDQRSQAAALDPQGPHQVQCRRLDSYDHLPSPDLVKIDIEGHEVAALEGMHTVLRLHHPWVVIEDKTHRVAIHDHLTQQGYRLHTQWQKDSVWHHPARRIDHAPYRWVAFLDGRSAPNHWPEI
jgi:FkbM family methyltransferase